MIRARFYLGTRPFAGTDAPHDRRRSVGWTATLERIADIALVLKGAGIDGATVTPAVGLWKGELEPSTVIELLGDYSEAAVRRIAFALRHRHGQDTVLWTMESIHSGTADR